MTIPGLVGDSEKDEKQTQALIRSLDSRILEANKALDLAEILLWKRFKILPGRVGARPRSQEAVGLNRHAHR